MEDDANYESDEDTRFEHSLHDSLIHAEVLLPHNDKMCEGIVKGRHMNEKGDATGQFHENPLLNSIIYDVEFSDGIIKEYAANIIAQNLYAKMSDDGKDTQALESIIDHATNEDALPKSKKFIICKNGKR